ncbi:uncharacterized protein PITG_15084 [Phytophthora infestans T30-4]|uniref:Uncharacterized protein n=1 Tax=Phytophthora infestans (strain T30-4) TaxID=403677 RepID=D0NRM1_PHYIT|nr:uncharacterized protein PITG_15084 [Phytophthora infestans T30-4]EEY63371.1 conserved hypothetical protein [Phytophthora infestans T30-4]|eukprot:XP_002898256.1 conserved hypothetical protein [Phytophthora infestans T30-4]
MTDGVELHHDLEEEDEKIEALRYFTRWSKNGAITEIQQLLQQVRKTDQRPSEHYYKKLKAETRVPRTTRGEILADNSRQARKGAARSFGARRKGGDDETRRFFKRNSEWQRDQSITDIQASAGHFYSDDYPIAERMASEWSHIFGESHADSNQGSFMMMEQFMNIPPQQRLTPTEEADRMTPITETETKLAIDHLNRHKTRGTTGLNHEFYKDFAEMMIPSLTKLFNSILQGAGVPP